MGGRSLGFQLRVSGQPRFRDVLGPPGLETPSGHALTDLLVEKKGSIKCPADQLQLHKPRLPACSALQSKRGRHGSSVRSTEAELGFQCPRIPERSQLTKAWRSSFDPGDATATPA